MGVVPSGFDRDILSQVSWTVPHASLGSQWVQYALRRYAVGVGPTGVSTSIAIPPLLRRRFLDWEVCGFSAILGESFVSFGRYLRGMRNSRATSFYGIDIHFGYHEKANSLWYCKSHEWLLQLHQAWLEPLDELPDELQGGAAIISGAESVQRFPGQQHRLTPSEPVKPRANSMSSNSSRGGVAGGRLSQMAFPTPMEPVTPDTAPDGEGAGATRTSEPLVAPTRDANSAQQQRNAREMLAAEDAPIAKQVILVFSNAEGHLGLLGLPVPAASEDAVLACIFQWQEQGMVPFTKAGRAYKTEQEVRELLNSSLATSDLFLLGFDPDLAATISPDETWEKYPRGYGEVVLQEDVQVASAADRAREVGDDGRRPRAWTGVAARVPSQEPSVEPAPASDASPDGGRAEFEENGDELGEEARVPSAPESEGRSCFGLG